METAIRQQLQTLKTISKGPSTSEVAEYLRLLILENVEELLRENASNHKVSNVLRGGLRAVLDASSPSDEDPIMSLMLAIIDQTATDAG